MITFEEFEDEIYIDSGNINIGRIVDRKGVYIIKWNDGVEQFCHTIKDAKDNAKETYSDHATKSDG